MATATPVNELSSEMTTGISAPPIGKTNSTPKIRAASINPANQNHGTAPRFTMMKTATPKMAKPSTALTACWPLYVTGRPVIHSCSFRKAMIDPEKLTAPIIALMTSETTTSRLKLGPPPAPGANSLTRNSAVEMSAAAPPPAPLKSATICGIAVIFTLSAEYKPMAPPTSTPTAMAHQPTPSICQIAAMMASSMPAAA